MNSNLWRLSHRLYAGGGNHLGRISEIIYNILCSNGISTKAKIGEGTVFYHHGVGCVVHELSQIGENCRIFSNVTIGCKWAGNEEPGMPPKIGNHVMIGAGAVILGDINIGDNSIIGANAVVLEDVPANSIAVGVPAVIKRRNADECEYAKCSDCNT